MSIQERQISYYFNSAVEAGSTKIGTLGNAFAVQLNNPITVPRTALYATLEVVSAHIWNVSPNISEAIGNNHIYIGTTDITIPDGLYGIAELSAFLNQEIADNSLPVFTLTEQASTQKLVITFEDAGTSIDFTKGDTCRDVMGFDSRIVTSTATDKNIASDTTAAFNRISSFFIKSNILGGGIPQNTRSSGIITGVPITSRVGSLINYTPGNPLRSNADELIGHSKQALNFTLLDQLERDVSTSGEEWTLSIVIRYYVQERGGIHHSGGTMTHGGEQSLL